MTRQVEGEGFQNEGFAAAKLWVEDDPSLAAPHRIQLLFVPQEYRLHAAQVTCNQQVIIK